MYTIEVPEVSEELLTQLDERVERVHAESRAEYIRGLIVRDIQRADKAKPTTFRDILAPVYAESAGMSEQELEDFGTELIAKVRAERRAKKTAQ